MQNLEQFWCGTEAALQYYTLVLKARETRSPMTADYISSGGSDSKPSEEPVPRLFSQSGDVGVISIYGPLVNNASSWNKYDGITGYAEIRDALVYAASDASVKGIVLDINSGGGAVSGVSDTADLISKIDRSIKPVHTFSDGNLASAAYWLGSSARTVDIGKVTEAGSLGVLTVHSEQSKMLSEMGVNITVLRAGEYKALGNPFEPLSDKARVEIQGQLDAMYTMFLTHVAAARGVSYPVADKKMGQGRIFMGAAAVEVGLADSISSFDAVVSKVQGAIDSAKKNSQYGANLTNGAVVKTALTEQQVAALAEAGIATPAKTAEQPATEKSVADAATALKAVADKAAAEATVAPATDLNAFLKTSLAEAQAANLDLTIKLRDQTTASAADKMSHIAFRNIAVASVDRLKVALGGSAGGADALSDNSLLAEHASLRAQFESKFKAGGVAAVSTTDTADKGTDVTDSVRQARLASTRIAK